MARKILLADDSVTAQNMGRKILADAGYEVITVNNGSAALKKISEQRPDLIVLDVYMPGYSGLEVCQRLKEVGDTSRIPILLTVGKLEPFKPEEAKRVHADAFIVKPFEASELLSALSKLEDKVVPRGETTKTGRFSRVSAAIEESRYDKSMAVEEDAGWKSRIGFPKKKKKEEKPVEPEADEASIYNPVNKDLRTVVEHPSVEAAPVVAPQEHDKPAPEDARVDVSALAPAGLPKDVTPEEIAALAAAAAQVQGKMTEENVSAPAAELPVVAPPEEAPQAEIAASSQTVEPVAAPVAEVSAPAASMAPQSTFAQQEPEKAPEKFAEAKIEDEKIEDEKVEHEQEKEKEKEKDKIEDQEPVPAAAASSAAMMAAIANLETEAVESAPESSGNESWSPSHTEKTEEPVTMAVATPANSAPAPSRWAAVTVALAPEDSGVSLEQEMQKAHAAYAAAEGATMAVAFSEAPAETVSEPHKLETAPAELAPIESISIAPAPVTASPVQTWPAAEAPVPATVPPSPAEAAPEAAETMSAVANVATDAISAAVAELESVAAAYAAEKAAASSTVSKHEAEEPTSYVSEAPQLEAKAEPTPVAEEKEETKATAETAEQERIEARADDLTDNEPAMEDSKASVVDAATEFPAATPAAEVPEEKASEERISQEPATAVPAISKARGADDTEKRESDTAAAWASWRKIRETGDSRHNRDAGFSGDSEETKDAAMAVAAGAEHNPEDANTDEADPEISSIVDSVLADLRPKIAEEISRKLGKKK